MHFSPELRNYPPVTPRSFCKLLLASNLHVTVGKPSLSNGEPSNWGDSVCQTHSEAKQNEPPKAYWGWSLGLLKVQTGSTCALHSAVALPETVSVKWVIGSFSASLPLEKSEKVIASCRNKGVSSLHKPLSLFFIQNAL